MQPRTAILAVLLAAATAGAQAPAQTEARPEADPIAYSGHGYLFAQGGRQIALTPDFVRAAQSCYARQVHRSASPKQRADFDLKAAYLADVTRGDERATLLAYTRLLERYAAQVRPADSDTLAGKIGMLGDAVAHSGYQLPEATRALLRHADVVDVPAVDAVVAPAQLAARKAYIQKCRDAGVPVPDVYQLGGSGWTDNKELTPLFIGPGDEAKVAYIASNDPKGVCIALPRYDTGAAKTRAIGLICMGSTTSKACFFDDKSGAALNAVMKLTDFASDQELKGKKKDVCTDCHAGENAFVIHPAATAFAGIPNRKPDAWYQPLVVNDWPQNPGPGPAKGKCNERCHSQAKAGRLPAVSTQLPGYCSTILQGAVDDTMSAYSDLAYLDQVTVMQAACARPPP